MVVAGRARIGELGRICWLSATVATVVGLLLSGAGSPLAKGPEQDRFDRVVIDAGHGGEDTGARGSRGISEKDLVLDVAKRISARLRAHGIQVVLTRDRDVFVPLEQRTSIANDARGDLFISIHANAARKSAARGIETYFVSLEASDDDAGRRAKRENEAFSGSLGSSVIDDPFVALLGDMIATQHVVESNEFAKLAQRELARIDSVPSRGVKQAPFVVLMGVQMPASLVEIGFLTNSEDEDALVSTARRDAISDALGRAVVAFGKRFDARRGVTAQLSVSEELR